VLQEREYRRVGGVEQHRTDVRIVAASNRDLEEHVRDGLFREDLFYRLNVVQVRMPSLRERPEDIPLLVDQFYRKFSNVAPNGEIIAADALKALMTYPFPGNVRELENMVERSLVLGEKVITCDSLPVQVAEFQRSVPRAEEYEIPEEGMNLEAYLDGLEKKILLQGLERTKGGKKKAAELLGLTFRSFRYRLAKFGMDDE
jgi:two-component system response regulator PilR (NtrC family)